MADPEVDFSPYSLVYVMPPRRPGIEFSPELNFYQEPLSPDGKVIRNGVTYGNDIFHPGATASSTTRPATTSRSRSPTTAAPARRTSGSAAGT